MKVALLAAANSPHTYKWVKSLSERGVEILLISFANAEPYDYSLKGVQSAFFSIKNGNLNSLTSKVNAITSLPKIKNTIKSFDPDVIHAHYASSYGLVGTLLRYKRFVISVWGSDITEFPKRSVLHKALLKLILEKAALVQATSYNLKEEVLTYIDKKVQVLPFGIDTDFFAPFSQSDEKKEFTIGVIKGLEKIYNVGLLIEAFKLLKSKIDTPLKLVIIGDGKELGNLKKYVSEHKIQNNVEFKGYLENNKLPAEINKMDLVVIPSLRESFGLSVIEAMSCEVPVLASNISGFKEVGTADTITYFNPLDASELCEKIQSIMENYNIYEEKAKLARLRVKENFNIEDLAKAQIQLYKKHLKL